MTFMVYSIKCSRINHFHLTHNFTYEKDPPDPFSRLIKHSLRKQISTLPERKRSIQLMNIVRKIFKKIIKHKELKFNPLKLYLSNTRK